MKSVTVLFFATLRERAGQRHVTMELPDDARLADLKQRLREDFPALGTPLEAALASINRQFAQDEDPLPPGAEVAFFPPVSGGRKEELTIVAITEESLTLDDLLERITLPSSGAACIFSGTVRAVTRRAQPHETQYLEYEAYRPMAEAKMRQIAQEMRSRWPEVQGIAIVQRVGKLEPGTPTVVIACTAAHRDQGIFEAARYGIDRLKEIVPVWKKEVGPDGEMWVEGEYRPTPLD